VRGRILAEIYEKLGLQSPEHSATENEGIETAAEL
jgi:hypothetical protein